MRIHRVLAEAAKEIIERVFRDGEVLDHVLARTFRENPRWGKRDRGFVAETCYEVVRWRRALAFVAGNENVASMCSVQWRRMELECPEWWQYTGAGESEQRSREAELAQQPRAVRESVPDWLDERCAAELGEEQWSREISALNMRARVYLRVNRLLSTVEQAREWLAAHGVASEPVPGVPDALMLPDGKILPKLLREDGRVEIQDAGSQLIAPMLGVSGGEHVVDACAGAGGKTLHLAALMANKGEICARDVVERKLVELQKRAARAGVSIVRTRMIDGANTHDRDGRATADALLLDAPCSGLGTLRRQPDLKWHLRPTTIERVCKIQKELLETYPAMLKPGGTLVYATCSVLPSENHGQITPLLESGQFELLEEKTISPSQFGFDGFYAAALRKR